MEPLTPEETALVVAFFVAVAACAVVAKAAIWWVKLIAFAFVFASISTILSILDAKIEWRLTTYALAFVLTGIAAWSKATANKVMSISFVLFGFLIAGSALETFGVPTEAGWSIVTRILVTGGEGLTGLLRQMFGTV